MKLFFQPNCPPEKEFVIVLDNPKITLFFCASLFLKNIVTGILVACVPTKSVAVPIPGPSSAAKVS
jgi:hypothetical protein